MTTDARDGASPSTPVSRRTLSRGLAWSVPAVAVAAPARAMAASPIPGLNGWVQVGRACEGYWEWSWGWQLRYRINLRIDGTGGQLFPHSDGFGLYVLNTNPSSTVTGAKITFYYPNPPAGNVTWTRVGGNQQWSVPTLDAGALPKPGYAAYTTNFTGTWTHTPASGSTPAFTMANGVPNFTATADGFTSDPCSPNMTVYARRSVTVDGDEIAFERSVQI